MHKKAETEFTCAARKLYGVFFFDFAQLREKPKPGYRNLMAQLELSRKSANYPFKSIETINEG